MDLSDVLWSGQGSAYSFTDSSNDSYSPSNSTSTPPFYQPHSPLGNLTFPFLQESQYSPHPPHQPTPFENVMLPDIQMEANGESGSDGALPSEAVRQGGVVPQRVGSGPWRCQHCPKVIVKHSQFVIHRRSHTGEKPYRCFACDRPFSTKPNCNRHIKNVHHS